MVFKVSDAMTVEVVSTTPDATAQQACYSMLRHHISGLVVLGDKNELIGIVTEVDVLKLLLKPSGSKSLVSEIMSTEIETIAPNDNVFHAAEIFSESGVRRLPVISDGQVIGVLARRDLIRHFKKLRQMPLPPPNG